MNKRILFLAFLLPVFAHSQSMTLTSIVPIGGTNGTSVTLNGTNLGNTINVFFGTNASIIQSVSSTQIITTAPNLSSGTYCTYASTGKINSNCLNFTYGGTPTSTPTNTATYTATPTNTAANTPTNTATSTPTNTTTPTATAYTFPAQSGSAVTVQNELVTGIANTYTPTPSPTFMPNVVLIGKSLGTGTAVTPTPTIVSNVLTIFHSAHGYSAGDIIVLAGVTASPTPQAGLDGLLIIQSVTTNTYTVNVAGTGAIAGTMTEMFWFKGTRCLGPSRISNIIRAGTGLYTFDFLDTQADSNYGVNITQWDSSHNSPIWGFDSKGTTSFQIQCAYDEGSSLGNVDAAGDLELYLFGIQ